MNKYFGVFFLLIGVGLGGWWWINQKGDSLTEVKKLPDNTGVLRMDLPGYLDYGPVILTEAQLKGKVVLFFAASGWCQSCSKLDEEIRVRLKEIPRDLTILKVDYDNDKLTNSKYGVTIQHTLVVLDESGNELNRWVGGDFDELIDNVYAV